MGSSGTSILGSRELLDALKAAISQELIHYKCLHAAFDSEWTGDDHSSWWSKLFSLPEYFLQLFGLNRLPVDKSGASSSILALFWDIYPW